MAFPTISAQGTTLTITDTVAAVKAFDCLISFTGFDGESDDKDRTCLSSVAREFAGGLRDGGNLSVELFYDPAQEAQLAALELRAAQMATTAVLTLSDGTIITFPSYVKSLDSNGEANADITGTLVLKVAGKPVFT